MKFRVYIGYKYKSYVQRNPWRKRHDDISATSDDQAIKEGKKILANFKRKNSRTIEEYAWMQIFEIKEKENSRGIPHWTPIREIWPSED